MSASRSGNRGERARAGQREAPGRARPRAPIAITTSEQADRPLKTSETVARDVVHDIVSRGLQTGDRLPAEAAMLEQYGVGRESLREGLRLLEVQGLLDIRRGPGGGPIVGRVEPASLGRTSTLYFHLAGGTYAELFDAWATTESVLAYRAALNDDRDAVEAAMAPFLVDQPEDESDLDEYVTSHTRFHAEVARLAANRVLELGLQTIGRIVSHHIIQTTDPRNLAVAIEHHHAGLAKAIIAGQPVKSSRLMEEHIRVMAAFWSVQIGDQMYDLIDWR